MELLLEEIRAQNAATIEAVQVGYQSLEQRMDERFGRVDQRLDV